MPKILIIKPSSLGDIIHSLQVAQSIREQLPSASIDWVVRDRFQDLTRLSSTVNRSYIFRRGKGLKAFAGLIREIRQTRYDFTLDFQGLLRSGVLTAASRSSNKFGRSDAREGSTFFYQRKVPLPPQGRQSHAVDILLEFLPLLGLKKELLGSLSYQVSPLETIHPALKGTKPITLIPSSRQASKEWHGFPSLAQFLLENHSSETIVYDSHQHIPTPHLSQHSKFINTSGSTTVPEMISLISGSKLVIANDSGPMHLAAAMGIPTIALFGPTPPNRFAPYPPHSPSNHTLLAPGNNLSLLTPQLVQDYTSSILKSL